MHGLAVLILMGLHACSGDYTTDTIADKSVSDTGTYGFTDATTGTGTSTTLPPEQEDSLLLRAPAQTDAFVFVANPDRHTLTRVRVSDLNVVTTPVGNTPRIVLTTNDYKTAVVFNEGDDTVSIVDASTLQTTSVPVRALRSDGAVARWRTCRAVARCLRR